jgi:hypothetical protein
MRFSSNWVMAVWLSTALAGGCAVELDGPEIGEETSELAIDDPTTNACPITLPWCWNDDMDGIPVNDDNCPFTFNPDQTDCDGDRTGDACDSEDATWQTGQAPGTPPICWVDVDRHFGFFTLEFRGLNATVDVSACGNLPTNYQYALRDDENCINETTFDCCMRVVPASHPHREALCSHVDQNFCEHWPPPAPNPPPTTCNTAQFIFCLTNPEPLGNPPPDCNQFEVLVNACSYNEARTLAQNHATNWRLADGACPECP